MIAINLGRHNSAVRRSIKFSSELERFFSLSSEPTSIASMTDITAFQSYNDIRLRQAQPCYMLYTKASPGNPQDFQAGSKIQSYLGLIDHGGVQIFAALYTSFALLSNVKRCLQVWFLGRNLFLHTYAACSASWERVLGTYFEEFRLAALHWQSV